jgi:hypothetical protein
MHSSIFKVILSETLSVQGIVAEAERVSSTEVFKISSAPGVYVGLRIVSLLKIPSPEVVQSYESSLIAYPDKVIELPWQMIVSFPADISGI